MSREQWVSDLGVIFEVTRDSRGMAHPGLNTRDRPVMWCVPYRVEGKRWGYLRLRAVSREAAIEGAIEAHRRSVKLIGARYTTRRADGGRREVVGGVHVKLRKAELLKIELDEPFRIESDDLLVFNGSRSSRKKPECLTHADLAAHHEELLAAASGDYEPPTNEERKELDSLGDANA